MVSPTFVDARIASVERAVTEMLSRERSDTESLSGKPLHAIGSVGDVVSKSSLRPLVFQLCLCLSFVVLTSTSGVLLDRSDALQSYSGFEKQIFVSIVYEGATMGALILQLVAYACKVTHEAHSSGTSPAEIVRKGMPDKASVRNVIVISLLFVISDNCRLGALAQMGAFLTDVLTSPEIFAVAFLEVFIMGRSYSELSVGAFVAVAGIAVTFALVNQDCKNEGGDDTQAGVSSIGIIFIGVHLLCKSLGAIFNSRFLKKAQGGDWLLKSVLVGFSLLCYSTVQLIIFSFQSAETTIGSIISHMDAWAFCAALVSSVRMCSIVVILKFLFPISKTLASSFVSVSTGLLTWLIMGTPLSRAELALLVALVAAVFVAARAKAVLDAVYRAAEKDVLMVVGTRLAARSDLIAKRSLSPGQPTPDCEEGGAAAEILAAIQPEADQSPNTASL